MPSTYLRQGLNRSKRKRHRYIGFRILGASRSFGKGAVIRAIREKAIETFGDAAKDIALRLVRFNGKEGAVHCFHAYKDDAIRLLRSIDTIGNEKVRIETVGTSGTIKALNRKFFRGELDKKFAVY